MDLKRELYNKGLHDACQGGRMKLIKIFIDSGANDWNRGFLGACQGGQIEIVKLMIKKGANDWKGGIRWACSNGNMVLVKLLIDSCADDLNNGLLNACLCRHIDIKLIKNGGANNLNNSLFYAVERGWSYERNMDIIYILNESGSLFKKERIQLNIKDFKNSKM